MEDVGEGFSSTFTLSSGRPDFPHPSAVKHRRARPDATTRAAASGEKLRDESLYQQEVQAGRQPG